MGKGIQDRKKEHVVITSEDRAKYTKTTGLERYDFIHNALPEVNLSDVSLATTFLDRTFGMPLFISSMTGGYKDGTAINELIAEICSEYNLPMGVGSQRAMLEDPEQIDSFRVAREVDSDLFIASNIGGCQLIHAKAIDDVKRCIEAIEADALIIHLNPLQELLQPEGDRSFKGIAEGIDSIVNSLDLPVIVKETGAGLSKSVIDHLDAMGVSVVDVAGAGGTSWGKVENLRIKDESERLTVFDDWGIPLTDILESVPLPAERNYEVIASGGIRISLDIIKTLCLGANMAATATPIIRELTHDGKEGVFRFLNRLQQEMQTTLTLLGVTSISELNKNHLRRRSGM